MNQGFKLWVVWLAALGAGIYGTAMIYDAIFQGRLYDLVIGIPVWLLGVWVTGNILASARQAYRRQKAAR